MLGEGIPILSTEHQDIRRKYYFCGEEVTYRRERPSADSFGVQTPVSTVNRRGAFYKYDFFIYITKQAKRVGVNQSIKQVDPEEYRREIYLLRSLGKPSDSNQGMIEIAVRRL